jgi:hypothetical protein
MRRSRKTILDERLVLGQHMEDRDFRDFLGDFVIQYITEFKKVPSFTEIVKDNIEEDELKDLDLMYDTYLKFKNEEITSKEYEEELLRLKIGM